MLNFKNTNIFFVAILASMLLLYVNSAMHAAWFALPVFIYSVIIFYGCYFVGSNFFIKIICSVSTTKKEIAISFDDGPATSFTPQILAILKQYNVQAAFFCIGKRISENKLLLKQIHDEGHLLGNHSYSHHFFFDLFSANKMLADLKMVDAAMIETVGLKPQFFRPPYGVTNPAVAKAIKAGGYIPIGWNVRSMDTVIKDEKKLLNSMNNAVKPGAIFLFHDTSKTTLTMLPAFIKCAHSQGYNITRLDKMLHLNPYA